MGPRLRRARNCQYDYCDETDGNKIMEKVASTALDITPPINEVIRMQDISDNWQEGPNDDGFDAKLDCSDFSNSTTSRNSE